MAPAIKNGMPQTPSKPTNGAKYTWITSFLWATLA
jgi:hypothetical protein